MSIKNRLLALIWRKNRTARKPPVPKLTPEIWRYLERLPKAEIHLHFEGAVSAPVILELGRKYGVQSIRTLSDAEWRLYFSNARMFFENFLYVSSLFQEADDFHHAAADLGRRLLRENIRYVELTLAPYKFMRSGIPYQEIIGAIDAGLCEATNGMVDHRYIIDIVRDLGPVIGMEMIREVEKHPVERVVGIGLGGGENFPPEDSAAIFEYAGAIGLRKTAHAGEGRGPDSVWGAIRALKVERIDHGVRSREDPTLVEYLAENQIPLNLCPTSNVMLGVIPGLEEHPFRYYHERGIPVNAGTDDPAFFKVSLTEELGKLIHYLGFRPEEIPALIENAIQASFLESSAKQALLTRFQNETRPLMREGSLSGGA